MDTPQRRRGGSSGAGFVYVLRARDRPLVKIGYTARGVLRRLRRLQTGCPETLDLVCKLPGTRRDEQALHARFASLRVRANGEWFRLEGPLATWVDQTAGVPLDVRRDYESLTWAIAFAEDGRRLGRRGAYGAPFDQYLPYLRASASSLKTNHRLDPIQVDLDADPGRGERAWRVWVTGETR